MSLEWIIGIMTIIGAAFGIYKVVHKANAKLDKVIIMQPVMLKGLFACLDGLHQLNCNGEVTKTREELLKTLIEE